MQWEERQNNFRRLMKNHLYHLSAGQSDAQQSPPATVLTTIGLTATKPPLGDPQALMQRADEINTVQRMLSDGQSSAVMIVGYPGAGKSTLAALLFRRLQLAKNAGFPAPHYLVWLTVNTYTTLADMIASILNGVNVHEPDFFLLKPEQQISTLLRALRRQENALVVLDQFESMLYPEIELASVGHAALPLFFEMLQTDLGASRVLLTSYEPLFEDLEETRVRSYLVSRISIPEGLALLQQRGVQGSPEELSLIWQRCSGQVFALVLFGALLKLSGISLSYLLNSPDYQPVWAGEVTTNLIASICYFLQPVQLAIMRVLSLFLQPVPLDGILMGIPPDASPEEFRDADQLEREIQFLTQLSLIQVSPDSAGTPCYQLHPLLRQYVLTHYLEGGEHATAESLVPPAVSAPPNAPASNLEAVNAALIVGHARVASYYQHFVRQHCPPRGQRRTAQDIEPIISAVRHLCFAGRGQQACDLLFVEGLHESMVHMGAYNALLGLYAALLPPFGAPKRRDEGLILSHAGVLSGRMGDHQQALACFEQAIAIQRQIGERHDEAVTLTNRGELLRTHGDYEGARTNFEHALALNEQHNLALRCILLHNLGLIYQHEKDYGNALRCYSESLKLAYKLPGQQDRGMILTNLGILLYEQGQLHDALAILLAALQLRQSLQDPGVKPLKHFLNAVEHKIGAEAYQAACQHALEIQRQVFSRFVP